MVGNLTNTTATKEQGQTDRNKPSVDFIDSKHVDIMRHKYHQSSRVEEKGRCSYDTECKSELYIEREFQPLPWCLSRSQYRRTHYQKVGLACRPEPP